ncbi:hypothetical protein RYX36_020445, partial [Vicia faba]
GTHKLNCKLKIELIGLVKRGRQDTVKKDDQLRHLKRVQKKTKFFIYAKVNDDVYVNLGTS